MTAEDRVTPSMCRLHRDVIETKLAATEKRVDGIFEEIQEVRQLQKNIFYAIIAVGLGVLCTLIGVIMGRGIDLGWMVP